MKERDRDLRDFFRTLSGKRGVKNEVNPNY